MICQKCKTKGRFDRTLSIERTLSEMGDLKKMNIIRRYWNIMILRIKHTKKEARDLKERADSYKEENIFSHDDQLQSIMSDILFAGSEEDLQRNMNLLNYFTEDQLKNYVDSIDPKNNF